MEITFSFWNIIILAAACGCGLLIAANAKWLWDNRYDATVAAGIVLIIISIIASMFYGADRLGTRRAEEASEIIKQSIADAKEKRELYLPGIWGDVYDAVDNVYGWESKWAIIAAVPVRYGIEDVHTLPGQGFAMIFGEFYREEDQVKIAVRRLLRPYITPFLDPEIGCASSIKEDFGEMLVLQKETE